MDAPVNHIEPHRETVAALRRAATSRVPTVRDRSYLAQISGVICMAIGVLVNDPTYTLGVLVVGGAFLWAALHHEDRTTDRDIECNFDTNTGLPLASALPIVLADDLATRSLTGRLAIVAIDIPAVASAEAIGDTLAARSLLASTTHRLRSQGWVGDAAGPFGPLVFLRRPGVFIVVLRDVLDDRTTRWLAERIVRVVGAPVKWQGDLLDPGATIGVAVGESTNNHELLRTANRARLEARRRGPGAVCVLGDNPTDALARLPRPIVAGAGGEELGLEFDLEPARSPQAALYFGLADFARNLDRALESMLEDDDGLCFVPLSPVALCRSDARQQILSRINDGGAHDRVALVVPTAVDTPGLREAWHSIRVLRQCGLHVYIDQGTESADPPPLPDEDFDGVIVANESSPIAAEARQRGLSVAVRWGSETADEDDDADATAMRPASGAISTVPERLIQPGREAQVATGRSVTSRW